jgi:hypothetical protein
MYKTFITKGIRLPNYGPEITGNQCEVRKCEISHQ